MSKLKEEVLQMVSSLEDENALAILKADIQLLKATNGSNAIDDLSPEDKLDLLELMNDDDEANLISHDDFLKATTKWRKK